MSLLSALRDRREERRARARFRAALRIDHLEHGTGIEPSDPELADLPQISVVRNPNDSLGWRPWVALGFPGEDLYSNFEEGYTGAHTDGRSRDEVVEKALDRLYGIYLAQRERPVEVTG